MPCIGLRLISHYIQVAQETIDRAGLMSKVKIIVSPAVKSLKTIPTECQFDLALIDVDQENNTAYFIEGERLVRKTASLSVADIFRYRDADLTVGCRPWTTSSARAVLQIPIIPTRRPLVCASCLGTRRITECRGDYDCHRGREGLGKVHLRHPSVVYIHHSPDETEFSCGMELRNS